MSRYTRSIHTKMQAAVMITHITSPALRGITCTLHTPMEAPPSRSHCINALVPGSSSSSAFLIFRVFVAPAWVRVVLRVIAHVCRRQRDFVRGGPGARASVEVSGFSVKTHAHAPKPLLALGGAFLFDFAFEFLAIAISMREAPTRVREPTPVSSVVEKPSTVAKSSTESMHRP